jgi:diketogulonate reductase-like aldo/keto reductase
MAQLSSAATVKLNNGVDIPLLGLGVYQSPPGKTTQDAVRHALKCGYRLVDTARVYGNEQDVGLAIRESRLPREEVFVTTKLWNSDHGYDSTIRACEESLRRLGLNYLDLYLIHWPVSGVRNESWRAMEKLLRDGKCRAIGVSNYTITHLNELLASSDTVPAVNQVEFHPFLYQQKLLEYCQGHGIQLEAYSPLTRGERLKHPKVVEIAKKHERTSAQILIRWAVQHSVVAIPKSVRNDRILENSEVFDFTLSSSEMKALDSLNEDFRTCWDPSNLP